MGQIESYASFVSELLNYGLRNQIPPLSLSKKNLCINIITYNVAKSCIASELEKTRLIHQAER